MNEEQETNAGDTAPRATSKKMDAKTLLLMVAVVGTLVLLIAFNMK
jgi:hypothetical protein